MHVTINGNVTPSTIYSIQTHAHISNAHHCDIDICMSNHCYLYSILYWCAGSCALFVYTGVYNRMYFFCHIKLWFSIESKSSYGLDHIIQVERCFEILLGFFLFCFVFLHSFSWTNAVVTVVCTHRHKIKYTSPIVKLISIRIEISMVSFAFKLIQLYMFCVSFSQPTLFIWYQPEISDQINFLFSNSKRLTQVLDISFLHSLCFLKYVNHR